MKQKTIKKLMALALVGCMSVSLLACGEEPASSSSESSETSTVSSTESGVQEPEKVINDGWFPIADEPITITVAGRNNGTTDWNETDVVKWVEENMNLIMDCTQFEADAWPTQLNLMLAGDELPDLIVGAATSIVSINEWAEEGYFLAMDEYLDYAPNLKAFLEENPNYRSMVTAEDGHIYGLTSMGAASSIIDRTRDGVYINNEWLKNVGKEVPTSLDELYDVLKAFKEQDANGNGDPNDEIPLSAAGAGFAFERMIMASYGIYTKDAVPGYALIETENGVELGVTTDNYKEMMKFLNKLCEEGLFDVASLSQTDDELKALVQTGRVGMFASSNQAAPYSVLGQNIEVDAGYSVVNGLTSEYQEVGVIPMKNVLNTSVRTAVSAKTEHPEAIMRFIDYLFTGEGSMMASRGTAYNIGYTEYKLGGEVYQISGTILPEAEKDKYSSASDYRIKKATIYNALNIVDGLYTGVRGILGQADIEDITEDIILTEGYAALERLSYEGKELVDVVPVFAYTGDEAKEMSTLKTDITGYVSTMRAQFISGQVDVDANWDTYIKTLEGMGLDKLLEIENAAYARFKGN